MNILDYPPTIESINEELIQPFLFNPFHVTFKDKRGEMATQEGFIEDGFSCYWFAIGGGKWMGLDLSFPFDKESIESKSLIVVDYQGNHYLLTLF